MSVVKRRSSNYTQAELDCLLRYLEVNPDLISAKLGGQYKTLNDIKLAWDDLSSKIVAVGGRYHMNRSGQEVKRKWADLKSRVKAKAATIAMETDISEGAQHNLKLSSFEERVLSIITLGSENTSDTSMNASNQEKVHAVKVYSFQNDSNSEDAFSYLTEHGSQPFGDTNECQVSGENVKEDSNDLIETDIVEEIKVSGVNEEKKRRLSEAFSAAHAADKKSLNSKRLRKSATEEEQLQELCKSQIEMNAEIRTIKDILKKCQTSLEKIALLKRAELRLKCAKYGVEFEDLFD